MTPAKPPPLLLAGAIYSLLVIYQKLQYENSLCYQKPPQYMWSAINQLYHLSYQHQVVHLNLSTQVVTRQAASIHWLYNQMCLHNLLNVRTMLRSSIMLLQRLLPVWAEQLTATIEPQTNIRVFVDLNSDNPPNYLTADSAINPYDELHSCLFIELKPLAVYLERRKQALDASGNEAVEYWLVTQVLMVIKHRYLERQIDMPTKYSPKQRATVIIDFNNIHYYVAERRSLMDIINAKTLPSDQLPRYDTPPKKSAPITTIEVKTFDSTDVVSHFRTLQLLNVADTKKLTQSNTAPPLRVVSLFLLCRPKITSKLKWSLGIVRWLNLDSNNTEVEWPVLGHTLNPCALRLDNPDTQNLRFVPAFIIAGDDDLKTDYSLLVPSYHFNNRDRVIIRIEDEQKSLRLQRCLLSSKEFSQYEFIML